VRDVHAAVHFLRPLRELGVETDETAPRLDLGSERRARGREWARGFGGDVLAIQPGSGSPAKNWPLAKFVALAGEAAGRLGLKPVFMLGEAEERIRDGLAADRRFPVAAGMSALELAERLSACAAYVGNDSGVTHLAVALGLPVVALFGPTDPRIWGPGGPNGRRTVRVIRAAAMTSAALAAVPIEGVLAELRGLVRP
jgi:ADP-heptose:LPS heptosyltransferase